MAKIENVELKVVGVTFKNPDGSDRQRNIQILMTQPNAVIGLIREPDNQYDKNAVAVFSPFGQIGYVGKEYAEVLAEMMDNGIQFTARVGDMGTYKNRNYATIIVSEV